MRLLNGGALALGLIVTPALASADDIYVSTVDDGVVEVLDGGGPMGMLGSGRLFGIAFRAGLGADTGVLGAGIEWRPDWFGVGFSSGATTAQLSITAGMPGGAGGPYATVFGAVGLPQVDAYALFSGLVAGASVGFDWRWDTHWSLKTGVMAVVVPPQWGVSTVTPGGAAILPEMTFGVVY